MDFNVMLVLANGFKHVVTTSQTVQINLTDASHHTAQSGWVNYDAGMTPAFLVNTSGVTTGWQLVVSGTSPSTDAGWANPTPTTPDFPGDIGASEWYISSGQTTNFAITGLNNSKTYTIKTFSYDPSSGNTTTIVWGGNSQNCNPNANPVELTFSSLTPSSGSITGTFGGSAANPIINGIIIIEN